MIAKLKARWEPLSDGTKWIGACVAIQMVRHHTS